MDSKAVEAALSVIEERIGCLIHTAAKRSSDALELVDSEPSVFRDVFDTNFYVAYNVLRAVLPQMRSNMFGRVILFTSEVTRNGLPKGSAYAAAKAAIVNLVKSVNREVSKHNVLVNCISPGPVDTKLEEDYRGEYLEFRKEYFKKFKETSNTGELVFMQEIALVVDMLMQAELRNLCGEEIFIAGGVS
jgi:NAD(P)-dependent dehydrogenase (short-subunit alcohol dehydrogenase family)